MIYPENFERKIGFTDIRTLLKGRCLSTLGTEWVDKHLRFMTSAKQVREALALAEEFARFSDEGEDDIESEFFDVREALMRIKPERTYMEETDLFALKRSMCSVEAYAKAFCKASDEPSSPSGLTPRHPLPEEKGGADEAGKENEVVGNEPAFHYLYPALARLATGREEQEGDEKKQSVNTPPLQRDRETGDDTETANSALSVTTPPSPPGEGGRGGEAESGQGGEAAFPPLIRRIDEVLNKYGRVKDTASTELLSLRHQIELTSRSISHSLRSIITEAQTAGYIERDVAPTLRDGRLMIPVAPALKKKIKGIVHDESATGKTVFIEPAAVVDANNKIRSLRAAERREVIRILQELTAEIRPHIPALLHALHFLAHIDFLRAQLQFARQFDAVVPTVDDAPRIDWVQARHPLLQQSLARHGAKVVPLDVSLRQGKRILLISGPNAGGKSVCLKTVGLLQYMLQCGMPVPCDERSKPGIFSDIMIDIGDQQSIENDLSTYSSHLLCMRQMMEHGGPRSLLLIDEFGSGTEPQIGGALAEAILGRFCQNMNFGIITTHYQNLKHFAEQNRSVVNGAMLYDSARLAPLFLLQVGNPGSSFAIEIARKMGLPKDIIDQATRIVGKDYVLSDRYVQDIVRDRMYWQSKRQGLAQREEQLETAIARYEREMTEFQQERKGVLAQAKADAKRILEESNKVVENTIRSIKEAQAEKEKTRAARAELADFKEQLEQNTDEQDRIARKIAKIQRRAERKANGEAGVRARRTAEEQAAAARLRGKQSSDGAAPAAASKKGGALAPGSYVRIKGQHTVGRIEQITGRSARILFGMMHTQVPLARLEAAEKPQEETSRFGAVATFLSKETRDAMREKTLHFRPEVDLRGMRVDEALNAVSRFIDDAIQLEQARVRVLHGTGTGALRELVRNYLATVPGVAHYHDEHVQFGGAGVTVVELA